MLTTESEHSSSCHYLGQKNIHIRSELHWLITHQHLYTILITVTFAKLHTNFISVEIPTLRYIMSLLV